MAVRNIVRGYMEVILVEDFGSVVTELHRQT